MENDITIMNQYLKEYNLELSLKQLEQFQTYYSMLIEWNSFMNLTAITEFHDVMIKHFIDSISLIMGKENDLIQKACLDNCQVSLLDIGTGAGFPAIPLKIVFPNIKITMIDSLNKRVKFLNEVITKLQLSDIKALHGRAEDYAKSNQYREQFDIVVSRAVANLATLSEYCIPYVKVNGIFVAYKSEEFSQSDEKSKSEKAISILGGKLEQFFEYHLPNTDYYRCLCIIKKLKATPNKYPRKAGLPSKEPIS